MKGASARSSADDELTQFHLATADERLSVREQEGCRNRARAAGQATCAARPALLRGHRPSGIRARRRRLDHRRRPGPDLEPADAASPVRTNRVRHRYGEDARPRAHAVAESAIWSRHEGPAGGCRNRDRRPAHPMGNWRGTPRGGAGAHRPRDSGVVRFLSREGEPNQAARRPIQLNGTGSPWAAPDPSGSADRQLR